MSNDELAKASAAPVIVQGFALNGVPLKETAPPVPCAGFDFAGLEHLVSTDNEFMGVNGTITAMKMTSSCMTPAKSTPGFAGAAQAQELRERGLACGCWKCLKPFETLSFNDPNRIWWMVVCPECGNKRCPRAYNHDNACSGSNEPGQDGSEK